MNKQAPQKRIFRRESDWKALIEEWRQSGKKLSIFCKEKKIAESGFYTWRNRFYPKTTNTRVKAKSSNLFVPITVSGSEKTDKGFILTYPNGCQLQITGSFNIELLHKLNQVMGVSPC